MKVQILKGTFSDNGSGIKKPGEIVEIGDGLVEELARLGVVAKIPGEGNPGGGKNPKPETKGEGNPVQ